MHQSDITARGIEASERVVLFDGVCKLCTGWAKFLIRFDRRRRFKLATMQSPEGQAILRRYGLPTDGYETLYLVEGRRAHSKSAAVLRVLAQLPWPWPVACIGWLVPSFIRDWVYDRVARNRYRLFGRYDVCVRPATDHLSRFPDRRPESPGE